MSRADRDPHRDPKGRKGERRGCGRKVRFSKIGAQLAASKYGDKQPYKCRFCHGWHLATKKR